jgi:uncharacterized protein (DUF58 family)
MDPMVNGKVRFNFKAIIGYLVTVAICLWGLFTIDHQFGFIFFIVLLIMPFISWLLMRAAAISVTVDASRDAVYKGETVEITVTVAGRGALPTPFLRLVIDGEPTVISASKKKPGVLKKQFKAGMWGTLPLGVSDIVSHDYLGLFKTAGNARPLAKWVSVYPAVCRPGKNDVLNYVCNMMMCDEKEDAQSGRQGFLSQPGYEFRPYVSGDPMNRVSWKLLAKTDTYMVRENETIKNRDVILLLDPQGASPPMEERAVEAVLAMLVSMTRQGIGCKVVLFQNGWREFSVQTGDQIIDLQTFFLTYTFIRGSGAPRVPGGAACEGGLAALFTCAPDYGLQYALAGLHGGGPAVIIPEELAREGGAIFQNIWLVNESYDFYAL